LVLAIALNEKEKKFLKSRKMVFGTASESAILAKHRIW